MFESGASLAVHILLISANKAKEPRRHIGLSLLLKLGWTMIILVSSVVIQEIVF